LTRLAKPLAVQTARSREKIFWVQWLVVNMFNSPKSAAAQNWHSFFLRPKSPYRFRRLLAISPTIIQRTK
jgi:hypothetical protein